MDKKLIINVAFNLIIENGLEEFSIAKLANKLECTKSSIYNYFKSKDELLNQIFIEKTKLLTQDMSFEDTPEKLIRQYAHNCIDNRDVFIFFHKYSHSNFVNHESMCEVKKELTLATEIAGKLIISGVNDDINPLVIEALVFGPIHGLVMRTSAGNNIKVSSKDVDDLVDFILTTIRKEIYERNSKEV